MRFQLKECSSGKLHADIPTSLEITQKGDILTFVFTAENCQYHCPFKGYNDIHTKGDACEILIGSDPNRRVYYEIEVSACNGLMICEMTYQGEADGEVLLDMNFVKEPFVTRNVLLREDGYVATVSFPISKILTGDGKIFFNAFRVETRGGDRMGDEKLLYALNPTMRRKFHTPSCYVSLDDYVNKIDE